MAKHSGKPRACGLGPEELRERAEAWARSLFEWAPAPSERRPWADSVVRAVVVETEDRDDSRKAAAVKRRLERNAAVRRAISGAMALVESGDLEGAREAVTALAGTDLPPVYWCESIPELAPVLEECLRHGEQCTDTGVTQGPAGGVVWTFVWYDPSHPV